MATSPYFAGDEFEDAWGEDGKPGIGIFSRAIQVWAVHQKNKPVTLNLASSTFRVPMNMIEEAVEWHPWMYLDGENIEHEGE